jgi:hypothetical protein
MCRQDTNRDKLLSYPRKSAGWKYGTLSQSGEISACEETKMSIQQRLTSNKVLITGDSHARGLAANLRSEQRENFEIIGNVIPGAGLHIITQAAKKDTKTVNRNDCIIICCGSFYINRNESPTGLNHIRIWFDLIYFASTDHYTWYRTSRPEYNNKLQ